MYEDRWEWQADKNGWNPDGSRTKSTKRFIDMQNSSCSASREIDHAWEPKRIVELREKVCKHSSWEESTRRLLDL